MKKVMLLSAAALSLAGISGTANAAVDLTTVDGTDPYSGPTPTYDFESPAPITGGAVRSDSPSGIAAQPYGSTGNYWTVGPADGSPGILDLSSFASIGSISFIWGSVDAYNTLDVLDRMGGILASFTGTDAIMPADGDQTDPQTNPLATLTFTGADRFNVGALRLSSTQNAFETDNFSVQAAVPEPATWLMLLVGFGFIGSTMRSSRRRSQEPRVRYAF